ncbi:MAG: hypothetical protein JW774_05830, partial [Candidatus Aureabacteria bacterium]|nr:hypothetical protein [Candidatus Auribacterota bacterium]
YSNDYFSGWSQLCNSRGQIFHDTVPTTFRPDPNHYTLRIPLYFRHAFLDGWILKRYDVYLNHPRLDLTIRFFLPDVSPLFLRTGIVTLNPEAFDGKKLHYSTVNGGKEIETFALKGKKISHTRFQNQICSATSCLGSTEGWVALHDDTNGLAVITPKYRLYSVPMVDYEDIKNKWLCRLYHSIAESDDTGRIFIRGLNEIRFTFMGFSSSQIEDVRKKAYHINHPSIVLLRKK